MIERLKNVVVAKFNSEELIALRAEARLLENEYATQEVSAPAWLSEASASIEAEMHLRIIDEKKRKLQECRAMRTALATPEEKRDRLDKEIASLLAEISKG